MHPDVHATTRTPGPSTVEPVVKEWRKPMSPVASAIRTSASGTFLLMPTRSSNGLFASSGVWMTVTSSDMAACPVKRSIDHVELLLAREPDEIDGVAGHTDGQV